MAKTSKAINPTKKTTNSKGIGGKKKSKWQIVKIIIAVIIILISIFIIYEVGRKMGFWGESDSVKYLKQDPLASTELPGLKLKHSEETPKQRFVRKSSGAYVTRWFDVVDNQSLDDAYMDLVDYAKRNGWVYLDNSYESKLFEEEYVRINRDWRGVKVNQNNYHMKLTISIMEPDDILYYHKIKSQERLIYVSLVPYVKPTITCGGEECE